MNWGGGIPSQKSISVSTDEAADLAEQAEVFAPFRKALIIGGIQYCFCESEKIWLIRKA